MASTRPGSPSQTPRWPPSVCCLMTSTASGTTPWTLMPDELVRPSYCGEGPYGQQFALFFLLATWLYLLSQLLLLGAVFNRMRLGAPREEGAVAQPGDRGEPPP